MSRQYKCIRYRGYAGQEKRHGIRNLSTVVGRPVVNAFGAEFSELLHKFGSCPVECSLQPPPPARPASRAIVCELPDTR